MRCYIAGAAELPDAMELIFQTAREVGTNGAVSKLPCVLSSFFFIFTSVILFSDYTIFDQVDVAYVPGRRVHGEQGSGRSIVLQGYASVFFYCRRSSVSATKPSIFLNSREQEANPTIHSKLGVPSDQLSQVTACSYSIPRLPD